MRILIPTDPLYDRGQHYHEASPWKAKWVSHADAPEGTEFERPFVAYYRLRFRVPALMTARLHVSADERYVMWLDELRLGRGPERGDREHWHFETYDVPLSAGEHELRVRVHSLGRHRPYAQISVRHGLLVMAEGEAAELLSTGIAGWESARVDAYESIGVTLPHSFVATGGRFRIDGSALLRPLEYKPVRVLTAAVPASARMESPGAWQLVPAKLPAMYEHERTLGRVRAIDDAAPDKTVERVVTEKPGEFGGEAERWQGLLLGASPVVIPAHTTRRVIVDLENYYCVYPRLTVSGGKGALVRLKTAEALFEADGRTKHHRDRLEGLHFIGQGDDLLPVGGVGGRVVFEPLWWLAGRYVQVAVSTGDEPVRIEGLSFTEMHYPYAWETAVTTSEPRVGALVPIALRSMEMCSHETYFDCPYYEQLMYVGDTRLEALVTYAMTGDERLPRKAIELFDESRAVDGWTSARYPTKTSQTIPPFSLWWVAMVYDYMMWRGGKAFVMERMAGVRAVVEAARSRVGEDGLFYPPQGWNFVDWIAHLGGHAAPTGNVPGSPRFGPGPTAVLHYHMVYTLRLAGELERFAGEEMLAQRHLDLAERMVAAGREAFWNEGAGLFRELPKGVAKPEDGRWTEYTQHAQCLAVLSGAVTGERERRSIARALFHPDPASIGVPKMAETTIYFTHYFFETCSALARSEAGLADEAMSAFFRRLELWYALPERGFKTTFESPEPTRSDCHAWGAHPLYHLYASVLGVRPGSPGFETVVVEPLLGSLSHAEGVLIHPKGRITVEVRNSAGKMQVQAKLPIGVRGEVRANGQRVPL